MIVCKKNRIKVESERLKKRAIERCGADILLAISNECKGRKMTALIPLRHETANDSGSTSRAIWEDTKDTTLQWSPKSSDDDLTAGCILRDG